MPIAHPTGPNHHAADQSVQPDSVAQQLRARLAGALRPQRGIPAQQQRRTIAGSVAQQWRAWRSALRQGGQWRRIVRAGGAAALAGSLVLGPVGASLALAAGSAPARFVERSGPINPFDGITLTGGEGGISVADIDGDGDLDAFIGFKSSQIYYYENTGTAGSPVYTERTGTDNPFNALGYAPADAPSFADLDGDGDLDAVLASSFCFQECTTEAYPYYENTGTATAPTFTLRTGAANPFNVITTGQLQSPRLVDIDDDGDFDVFVGTSDPETDIVGYYENTGTAGSPSFTQRTDAANPFPGGTTSTEGLPSFTDIDGDGDIDAFLGTNAGIIAFYENTGTAGSPAFTLVSGLANPFDGIVTTMRRGPAFVDRDADGDADAFLLRYDSASSSNRIVYLENTGDVALSAAGDAAEAAEVAGSFTLARTNPQRTGTLTFGYSLGGTATAGADYALVAGAGVTVDATTITLADGVDSATIQVVPVDDTLREGAETVTLTLTSPDGYAVKPNSATVLIADDEPARIFLPLVVK